MAEHHTSRTTHAYILITVDPTKTESVVDRLNEIPSSRVHEVMGPYDIIVELEVEAPEYIQHLLRTAIRPISGVQSTVTCTWME